MTRVPDVAGVVTYGLAIVKHVNRLGDKEADDQSCGENGYRDDRLGNLRGGGISREVCDNETPLSHRCIVHDDNKGQ